jgi:two-component response regulator ARR-B family
MLMSNKIVLCDLQKYRLYLKRLSVVASQQASIVAAFGGRDPLFLHMGAFEGLQGYQPFAPCAALSSFSPHGLLGRTSAATFRVPELAPAMTVQSATNSGIISRCAGDANNFQLPGLQEDQQAHLGQGSATSLGLPQLQQKWIQQENNDMSVVFSGSALANTLSGELQRLMSSSLPCHHRNWWNKVFALVNMPVCPSGSLTASSSNNKDGGASYCSSVARS